MSKFDNLINRIEELGKESSRLEATIEIVFDKVQMNDYELTDEEVEEVEFKLRRVLDYYAEGRQSLANIFKYLKARK